MINLIRKKNENMDRVCWTNDNDTVEDDWKVR